MNNAKGNTQKFTYVTPTATSVHLVGDFTNWQERPIPLRKSSNDVWHAVLWLKPGTHYYRFLVDGQWSDDPACQQHVPNPFGGQNAVRQVN